MRWPKAGAASCGIASSQPATLSVTADEATTTVVTIRVERTTLTFGETQRVDRRSQCDRSQRVGTCRAILRKSCDCGLSGVRHIRTGAIAQYAVITRCFRLARERCSHRSSEQTRQQRANAAAPPRSFALRGENFHASARDVRACNVCCLTTHSRRH